MSPVVYLVVALLLFSCAPTVKRSTSMPGRCEVLDSDEAQSLRTCEQILPSETARQCIMLRQVQHLTKCVKRGDATAADLRHLEDLAAGLSADVEVVVSRALDELHEFQSYQTRDARKGYHEFLRRFPTSPYAEVARLRVEELAREKKRRLAECSQCENVAAPWIACESLGQGKILPVADLEELLAPAREDLRERGEFETSAQSATRVESAIARVAGELKRQTGTSAVVAAFPVASESLRYDADRQELAIDSGFGFTANEIVGVS